jgi:hypothetical protein
MTPCKSISTLRFLVEGDSTSYLRRDSLFEYFSAVRCIVRCEEEEEEEEEEKRKTKVERYQTIQ